MLKKIYPKLCHEFRHGILEVDKVKRDKTKVLWCSRTSRRGIIISIKTSLSAISYIKCHELTTRDLSRRPDTLVSVIFWYNMPVCRGFSNSPSSLSSTFNRKNTLWKMKIRLDLARMYSFICITTVILGVPTAHVSWAEFTQYSMHQHCGIVSTHSGRTDDENYSGFNTVFVQWWWELGWWFVL